MVRYFEKEFHNSTYFRSYYRSNFCPNRWVHIMWPVLPKKKPPYLLNVAWKEKANWHPCPHLSRQSYSIHRGNRGCANWQSYVGCGYEGQKEGGGGGAGVLEVSALTSKTPPSLSSFLASSLVDSFSLSCLVFAGQQAQPVGASLGSKLEAQAPDLGSLLCLTSLNRHQVFFITVVQTWPNIFFKWGYITPPDFCLVWAQT